MPEQIVPPPAAVGARRRVHWQHLVAAPHRVFFFGGVWALVLAVLWWGAVLAARHTALPPPAITLAPQWVHGWLMVFGSFTFFVFGFLMTALPRWVGAKPIAARIYCPVAIGLMCGYLLALLGGLWSTPVAAIGMGLTFLAWLAGVVTLARLFLVHNPERKMHPGWAIAVVGAGCVAALAALFGTSTGHWTALADAPEFAAWAFLAAIVFVVFHRIGPFFAQGALGKEYYQAFRPHWCPPFVVLLLWLHALLTAAGHAEWVFVTDLPLLLVTGWLLLRWQPWKTRSNALLWTLFAAFAWLPIALALSSLQALALLLHDSRILGLAPLHALAVGLAASMVFAMATRVSMGHSGRPLHMDRFNVACFLVLQLAVVTRICAEFHGFTAARGTLLMLSSLFWLCAFAPWAARLSRIYWQPRVDGRPG